jgi:hypothetical protein
VIGMGIGTMNTNLLFFQDTTKLTIRCSVVHLGAFGLQIISTNIFAYCTDCYKPQTAQIMTLLNFGRQTFSFTLGFYM